MQIKDNHPQKTALPVTARRLFLIGLRLFSCSYSFVRKFFNICAAWTRVVDFLRVNRPALCYRYLLSTMFKIRSTTSSMVMAVESISTASSALRKGFS